MKSARFYNNTGFNSVDIPDSFDLIEENAHQVFYKRDVNLIQKDNIYKLSVKGIVEGIARSIDYVIIEDESGNKAGYFIEDKGYEFVAPNTCIFYLHLDPYITIGGLANDNEIISGSANRMTVNETEDDTLFFTILEPFKPSLRSTILEGILDGRMRDNDNMINILETLVIPPKILKDDESRVKQGDGTVIYNGVELTEPNLNDVRAVLKYRMAQTDAMVTQTKENVGGEEKVTSTTVTSTNVFEFRQMRETYLTIKGLYGDNKIINTGTRWWRGDQLSGNATIAGTIIPSTVVNDLRHTGTDSNINSYWSVPAPYIESNDGTQYQPQEETNYGGISNIISSILESSGNDINSDYTPFNIKNNKAKYGQGTSIIVYCPVNGNKIEKKWSEIIDVTKCTPKSNQYLAPFKIGADIRPDGSPIFAFKYMNGKTGDIHPELWGYSYGEVLNGGNWRQIPISGQGSNNAINQLALNQSKDENKGSSYGQVLFGFGQLIAGLGATYITGGAASPLIGTGAKTIIGGIGSYIANSVNQKNQQELLNQQGELASANITYSSSNYIRELGYNTFYVMYIMYAKADLKAFDRFLTLYGYNVGNKKITSDDFNSRPGFNYIRINDIDIQSDKGIWLVERVKEQLKAGVRIWHEMPNNARIVQGNKGFNRKGEKNGKN